MNTLNYSNLVDKFRDLHKALKDSEILNSTQIYEYFSAMKEQYSNAKEGTDGAIVKNALEVLVQDTYFVLKKEKVLDIENIIEGLTVSQAKSLLRDILRSLEDNSAVIYSPNKTLISRHVRELKQDE